MGNVKWKQAASSFRGRLIVSFMVLGLVAALILIGLLRVLLNLEVQRNTQISITQLKLEVVDLIDHDKEFLNENYLDTGYYKTGQSQFLEDREIIINKIVNQLDSLMDKKVFSNADLAQLNQVVELVVNYN